MAGGWKVTTERTVLRLETEDRQRRSLTIDALDAESLYRTLEQEVVPLFYNRDDDGLPRKWIAMMKRAIQTLAPKYNSDRMVEEYARKIYSSSSSRHWHLLPNSL